LVDVALQAYHPTWSLTQTIGRVFLWDGRCWTIQQFFMPMDRGRTVRSGVRALVIDEWGFIGFINQRDLEVLLEIKKPREWCHWLGAVYPETDSPSFFGVCCDSADLLDELFVHETEERQKYGGMLPGGLEYWRSVHLGKNSDEQQLVQLLWDADPATQMSPDPRFETLDSRWKLVHREKVQWR